MLETDAPPLAPPEAPLPAEPTPEGAPATPEPATPIGQTPVGAEGAEEGEEPTVEAPAWAAIQEVEQLFDNPDVKAHHEMGVREAHDRAYSELQGHMQPFLQGNKQLLERIASASETVVTTIDRAVEDGVLDKRVVEDLVRTHRNEFAALNQTYQTVGYWEGVKQYTGYLLGSDAPGFLSRLERMQQNIADPTFAADLQKKVKEAGRKDGYDEGYRKGLKEGKAAATAQSAIKGNKGAGANLTPGTPGAGQKDEALLMDPTTPIETIMEIRARQKAAGG